MRSGVKRLAVYGGSGAGTGAAFSFATGAKAVGLLGGFCAGAPALPVFLVVGGIGGLAILGIRMAFKRQRW
ncbi:MAG: hypothetical protein US70_C0015G0002 [Parcubacteria group bacterium GW2011_GWD2_38_11]|nr:MAG: hypothetical protein US70_C0015G0002 [Parcubacteria group bacterium GW2011_GWD2_38_11]